METLGNKLVAKSGTKVADNYYCKKCDYICCKLYNWKKHLSTSKHNQETKETLLETKSGKKWHNINTQCDNCNKEFKSRSGLWKHKKICEQNILNIVNSNNVTPQITPELLIKLIEQNKELQQTLIDQNKTIIELAQKTETNNYINSNSNNKTFNLQLFLNETCKNALNINEFVSSIKVSLSELENTGRQGYIQGISSIIINKLNKLNHCDRPIHCSDQKRETLYIKNDNQWIKETEEKPILKQAIKTIANENIKLINTWRQQYPDCTVSDSNKNDLYLKIVSNSMSGSTKEESDKNYEKIISNVAKQVLIDK